ncbi:hypothetical protein F2Q68_00035515 [Brassica cretica]|uniref:Uncharacterized protein n=1 Tax=Brassica cretica TaxID=69181 RepID=A0A8S9H125_BRACR|nr:hypothetical protein F2Q68_00035515 [Brassica cretica]
MIFAESSSELSGSGSLFKSTRSNNHPPLFNLFSSSSSSCQRAIEHYVEPQPKAVARYVSTIFATKLGDNEVMVQISSSKNHNFSISNVLSGLEEDGFVLVDVSSSRYHGEWLFYSLHLQMGNKDNHKLKCEELSQRILYLYEECENSFR